MPKRRNPTSKWGRITTERISPRRIAITGPAGTVTLQLKYGSEEGHYWSGYFNSPRGHAPLPFTADGLHGLNGIKPYAMRVVSGKVDLLRDNPPGAASTRAERAADLRRIRSYERSAAGQPNMEGWRAFWRDTGRTQRSINRRLHGRRNPGGKWTVLALPNDGRSRFRIAKEAARAGSPAIFLSTHGGFDYMAVWPEKADVITSHAGVGEPFGPDTTEPRAFIKALERRGRRTLRRYKQRFGK